MAFVRVEQRNAHLAGEVQLGFVNGRDGQVAKAVLTAISNARRGGGNGGDDRTEEATAIQWTLWGRQAENAAEYLGKGSHVNIVGRLRNNNYEKDGQTVYGMAFTAEEVDYLETKAQADARRARGGDGAGAQAVEAQARQPATGGAKPGRARRAAKVAEGEDIPF
jgi:single stranded DNA-binding protein